MDENASKAVFIGVSVLVAVITLSLIINFYDTAKASASVANRYDISDEYNKRVYTVLEKDVITGLELRYLLNYLEGNDEFKIRVYNSLDDKNNNIKVDIDMDDYWSEENQKKIDDKIRPNYNYELEIIQELKKCKVVAVFAY